LAGEQCDGSCHVRGLLGVCPDGNGGRCLLLGENGIADIRPKSIRPDRYERVIGIAAVFREVSFLEGAPIMITPSLCSRNRRRAVCAAAICLAAAVFAAAAPAAKDTNMLKQADFTKLKNVPELPAPWQTTSKSAGITVRIVNAKATPATWVQLKDESAEAAANIRQSFGAVPKGRFSVFVRANGDHTGGIGIYLGTGTAGTTEDRMIDIKTSDNGTVRIGTRGERQNTPLAILPGDVFHVWVDWAPGVGDSLDVKFGVFDNTGTERQLSSFSVKEAKPITALRITSDTAAIGAHFLVSQPRLEAR